MRQLYAEIVDESATTRMETFSDGIFAIAATLLRRGIVATDGLDMFDYVAMAPSVLFNVMMAAAFWGYMQGRRPNLFYRRRVRL